MKIIINLYFWIVKWFAFKPITKLSYIVNGKMLGPKKWYERTYDMENGSRWKWLTTVAYKLGKYVCFR